MFNYQCKKCLEEGKSIKSDFDTVTKTFYKMQGDEEILCFKHWHQSNRPKEQYKGIYESVCLFIEKQKIERAYLWWKSLIRQKRKEIANKYYPNINYDKLENTPNKVLNMWKKEK
jgi:hypothetical protein